MSSNLLMLHTGASVPADILADYYGDFRYFAKSRQVTLLQFLFASAQKSEKGVVTMALLERQEGIFGDLSKFAEEEAAQQGIFVLKEVAAAIVLASVRVEEGKVILLHPRTGNPASDLD